MDPHSHLIHTELFNRLVQDDLFFIYDDSLICEGTRDHLACHRTVQFLLLAGRSVHGEGERGYPFGEYLRFFYSFGPFLIRLLFELLQEPHVLGRRGLRLPSRQEIISCVSLFDRDALASRAKLFTILDQYGVPPSTFFHKRER